MCIIAQVKISILGGLSFSDEGGGGVTLTETSLNATYSRKRPLDTFENKTRFVTRAAYFSQYDTCQNSHTYDAKAHAAS